jgi:hypothetical protein
MGTRQALPERPIGGGVAGTHFIELWIYDQHSYERIDEVRRAALALLDHNTSLKAVHDRVAWARTTWDSEPFGEQLDDALTPHCPVVMSRYAAVARELIP